MLPRRRSSRLRNATPLKLPAHIAAQLESVTEYHEASMLETQIDGQSISSTPKTPVTAGRIRPAPEEMHPSKAHQSTTQEPDSGLRLGFTDIKAKGSNQPSGITQKTPSKINVARPSFDFRCTRPGLQLGPEAQRIMDELNEEALRIKASLAAEREEKKRIASCDESFKTQRRTKSRHKTGRFSDAHQAEFRKMDSIAGHPSAFRAQLSRTAPTKNRLKRSQSKAQLDTENSDEIVHKIDGSGVDLFKSDRHMINQPMKVARKHITDDISSASRCQQISSTLDISSSRSKIPSAINIPTQASLSRTRVKRPMPRGPTLSKSQQKSSCNNPLSPNGKSAFNGNPSKSDRVRFPVPSLETAIESTTLTNLKSKNDLQKVFSLSNSYIGIGNFNKTKNVNFTPKTINKHAAAAQNSPSPIRSDIARSISKPNLNIKSLNASSSKAPETLGNVEYPSLSNFQSPHRILCQDNPISSIPSNFTFRSDQTIKFGASPSHPRFTTIKNSNSQLLRDKGSSLEAHISPSNHKENEVTNPLSSPGISNKRRKRPYSDEEQNLIERSSKKPKHQDTKSSIPRLKVTQGSLQKIQSPQKKSGVLSLSRLNILSRPKIRR
ncbi:putative erythromycin esterase [Erysiphe neolycopersici]|uniref:Putative erythromycin esterase n=1 Tax=Erysiphe neolycopersici TaxID=212602 RepID=A0A420I0C5_9PEZI|nr:putative erythromycin esterase [Erysiphe neolycopersici]